MPNRPPQKCAEYKCNKLIYGGHYCDAHKREFFIGLKDHEKERKSANERGYTSKWQKMRLSYLRQHPLCAVCSEKGITKPAVLIDHIQPHKGDMQKFWNQDNWQGLCIPCHITKTVKEIKKDIL